MDKERQEGEDEKRFHFDRIVDWEASDLLRICFSRYLSLDWLDSILEGCDWWVVLRLYYHMFFWKPPRLQYDNVYVDIGKGNLSLLISKVDLLFHH